MNILFFLIPKQRLSYLYDNYTIRQGLEKIRITGYTAIPVISRQTGEYIGTVSEGDFLWEVIDNHYAKMEDLEDGRLYELIDNTKYPAVKIDAKVDDLVELILNQNFVPVVDDRNIFMGIITRRSVMDYFYRISKGDKGNENE